MIESQQVNQDASRKTTSSLSASRKEARAELSQISSLHKDPEMHQLIDDIAKRSQTQYVFLSGLWELPPSSVFQDVLKILSRNSSHLESDNAGFALDLASKKVVVLETRHIVARTDIEVDYLIPASHQPVKARAPRVSDVMLAGLRADELKECIRKCHKDS